MDTLYTFWDNMTDYETKSVHFGGLMNSATKGSTPFRGLVLGPGVDIMKAVYELNPYKNPLQHWPLLSLSFSVSLSLSRPLVLSLSLSLALSFSLSLSLSGQVVYDIYTSDLDRYLPTYFDYTQVLPNPKTLNPNPKP